MGFDLNRHWQEPSPWAHPTLYATKNLLIEIDNNDVRTLYSITITVACMAGSGGNIFLFVLDYKSWNRQLLLRKLVQSSAVVCGCTVKNM